MSDVLALAGVSVRRGATMLLEDVNWDVEEGERWVILGPNGAGKTTLLQIAAARLHPTSGVAGILGEVLGAVDVFELRPRVGLASRQWPSGSPATSSWGTSSSPPPTAFSAGGVSSTTTSTTCAPMELLKAMGVDHLADRHYRTLSEGERKRVQIARALMTDPELMLLDEPAAGLDLGGREELVRRLGELAADTDAPALVLVTHHVEEIPPSFTDVLLLRQGRVVAAGPDPDHPHGGEPVPDLRAAPRARATRRPLVGLRSDVTRPLPHPSPERRN